MKTYNLRQLSIAYVNAINFQNQLQVEHDNSKYEYDFELSLVRLEIWSDQLWLIESSFASQLSFTPGKLTSNELREAALVQSHSYLPKLHGSYVSYIAAKQKLSDVINLLQAINNFLRLPNQGIMLEFTEDELSSEIINFISIVSNDICRS